jgi:adenylate cyclase class 2
MTIEAELKARLANPHAIRERLDELATGRVERYRDVYFDVPDGYELRVRTISSGTGERHLLTYKEPAVDAETGSKPEYETLVEDPAATARILTGLGHAEILSFTKDCVNYPLRRNGREILATLVTVPEIEGTYLEVETAADEESLADAIAVIRAVLAEIGVTDTELTTDTYTDAVRAARK